MNQIRSIFQMLKDLQSRPWTYLWSRRSIYDLLAFEYGYQIWVGECGYEEVLQYERYYKFQDYIIENTIWMDNRTNDCWKYWDCLLKVTKWDEERAYNLFFELLDKYIAKEQIVLSAQSV